MTDYLDGYINGIKTAKKIFGGNENSKGWYDCELGLVRNKKMYNVLMDKKYTTTLHSQNINLPKNTKELKNALELAYLAGGAKSPDWCEYQITSILHTLEKHVIPKPQTN